MEQILISGFADEIDPDFEKQLDVVSQLGMKWISLRSAWGKNIADYTAQEVSTSLAPLLRERGIGVSSLGSPIGKIDLNDDAAFVRQSAQLEELCRICRVLGTRYIRIFSFYTNRQEDPDCLDLAVRKLTQFCDTARRMDVVLLLENEKGVYGDTGMHSRTLLERIASPHCRAAFDFANFVQCGDDPEACWDLLRGYTAYIHIKDALYTTEKNVPCGTGDGKIEHILRRAVFEDGYRGFLTLEPHLCVFDGLQSLERGGAEDVIGDNGVTDGAQAYALQYRCLTEILAGIAGAGERFLC